MTSTLVPMAALDATTTDRVRTIFEDGFPEPLRAPWAEVSAGLLPHESSFAIVHDDIAVGFVVTRELGTASRVYLRYLVVEASRRSQGIGSAAWSQLTTYYRTQGCSLLVWDVERPDDPGLADDEVAIRRRRIAFYTRLGGVTLPVTGYTTPHEDEHGTHEIPMQLMAASLGRDPVRAHDVPWRD